MARYFPEPVPYTDDLPYIREWLGREFSNILVAFEEVELVQLEETNIAPTAPREGMIRLADGTNWNPGQGSGFYGYRDGAWFKLDLDSTDTATFDRLRVNNNTDINSLTQTDQPVQIGTYDTVNMMIDGNEIQARLNGAATSLNLQLLGGDTVFGSGALRRADDNGLLHLVGGGSSSTGANIELYGGTHATLANRAFYDALDHSFRNQAGTQDNFKIENNLVTFFNGGVRVAQFANDTNGALELGKVNGGTSTPFIDFHSSATVADYNARIIASGGSGTAGSGKLEIHADGNVSLVHGRLEFPATQNASTGVNVLDDYEEGTFTPTLNFAGGSTGITYSIQSGAYVKIGKAVYFRARVQLSNKGSSTGGAAIVGLPFTPAYYGGQLVGYYNSFTGLTGVIVGYTEAGLTQVSLVQTTSTGVTSLTDTAFTNTSDIILSGVYDV